MQNIDSTTAEGMRLTTIMEFSDDESKSKEDSSVDFLAEPVKAESDTSTAEESIESINRKPVEISCKELISILSSKDRFPTLAAAFDKKRVNVAWVDLSHSQYSYLLSSSSGKTDISKSFDKMIEIGEKGEQLLVLYTKGSSKKRPFNSLICLEREKLEFVTENIDKIDRLYNHCSKPLDFYDVANVINTATVSDFYEE